MSEKIKILGIYLDKITTEQAVEKAILQSQNQEAAYFATPNPEIILKAITDSKFKEVINHSKLNTPDGIGLIWAAHFLNLVSTEKSKLNILIKWFTSLTSILLNPKSLHNILPERVTGVDLMQKTCKASAEKGIKVFLLGAQDGIAEKLKINLEEEFESQFITGTSSLSPIIHDEESIINQINKSQAQILFVAYGAPTQELWIAKNLNKLTTVKLAIGVGGAFDFLTNNKKRAPELMQKLGLEWLYRLIQEPSRIGRIFNATIKFPIKIISSFWNSPSSQA